MIRAGVLGIAILAAACGGGDDGTLEVFAASSLQDALPALEGPRYTFAGSDALARQIREGAEADVFAAASPTVAQALFDDGLLTGPRVFAGNRLVLVVPRDNEARIHGLRDLGRDGVRVVLGDQGVPAGDYAREAIAAARAGDILDNVVSLEEDVRGVVAKVALGEADAGFVYATDARAAADALTVVELPAAALPDVRYVVGVVTGRDRRAEAEAFVQRLVTAEGRVALRQAGFEAP